MSSGLSNLPASSCQAKQKFSCVTLLASLCSSKLCAVSVEMPAVDPTYNRSNSFLSQKRLQEELWSVALYNIHVGFGKRQWACRSQ